MQIDFNAFSLLSKFDESSLIWSIFLIFILQFIGDNPPHEDQSGNTTRATETTIIYLSQLYEFEAL